MTINGGNTGTLISLNGYKLVSMHPAVLMVISDFENFWFISFEFSYHPCGGSLIAAPFWDKKRDQEDLVLPSPTSTVI